MALLVPNEGEQEMLERIVNASATGDVVIHLYSNDVTPGETDTLSTYTLVDDPNGITLTGASWDTTSTVGTAEYAQQTFTYSGTGTAYGYVVTDSGENLVLCAERFTYSPYEIPSCGGTIKVTPKISLN